MATKEKKIYTTSDGVWKVELTINGWTVYRKGLDEFLNPVWVDFGSFPTKEIAFRQMGDIIASELAKVGA